MGFLLTVGITFLMVNVNFLIDRWLTNKKYLNYINDEGRYYNVRINRKFRKQDSKLYFRKMFGNSVKKICYVCKPIVFQFIFIVVGLRLLRVLQPDYTLFFIGSYGVSWFPLYFVSYISFMKIHMEAVKLNEQQRI